MNSKRFEEVSIELDSIAEEIASAKRPAYSQNEGADVVANFKRGAEGAGIRPLQAWLIHFEKQYSGIATYVRTGAESEPIESRFADVMNYLYLGFALLKEEQDEQQGDDMPMSNDDLETYANYVIK
tara:strand:- start:199 stop:576 length:378 start_codon:yes stop_codon:yes gene_type:complete